MKRKEGARNSKSRRGGRGKIIKRKTNMKIKEGARKSKRRRVWEERDLQEYDNKVEEKVREEEEGSRKGRQGGGEGKACT